jgi:KaiC/GvpD/RAD55 family RecA-like ATPase
MISETKVLNALRQRDIMEGPGAGLEPEYFSGRPQRAILEACKRFFAQGSTQAQIPLETLAEALPEAPGVAAILEQMSKSEMLLPGPETEVIFKSFIQERLALLLTQKGMEWVNDSRKKPEKSTAHYGEVLKAAGALLQLEESLAPGGSIKPSILSRVDPVQVEPPERIPTRFLPELDKALKGGIPKGKLGGVMAPLGVGKTLTLCNMGAQALVQGKNVVHVSLEMDESAMIYEYYAILMGVPVSDLEAVGLEGVIKRYGEFWGNLYLYDYSGAYCSIGTIERLFRKHQDADMFLLDYLTILDRKEDNLYQALGVEAKRLRRCAHKHNVATITAAQAGRHAIGRDRAGHEDTADSIQIPQIADWWLALAQPEIQKKAHRITYRVTKNRFGSENAEIPAMVNYKNLRVCEEGYGENELWSNPT